MLACVLLSPTRIVRPLVQSPLLSRMVITIACSRRAKGWLGRSLSSGPTKCYVRLVWSSSWPDSLATGPPSIIQEHGGLSGHVRPDRPPFPVALCPKLPSFPLLLALGMSFAVA